MNRDQMFGGLILIVAAIILIAFLTAFFAPHLMSVLNISKEFASSLSWWAIAIPVFLLVILALVVVIWIGYTMLTTPPPMPIDEEEIQSGMDMQRQSRSSPGVRIACMYPRKRIWFCDAP